MYNGPVIDADGHVLERKIHPQVSRKALGQALDGAAHA